MGLHIQIQTFLRDPFCEAVSLFSEQLPNDEIVFSRGFALVIVNCGHYHGEKSCIA